MSFVDYCFEKWGRRPVEQLLNQFDSGVFYQVKGIPRIDVANRCMEKIRLYCV